MYQKASSHITIGVKPTNPKTYKKGTQGVEKLPNSFVFYFIYHFILQPLGYFIVSTLSLSPSPAPPRLSTNPSIHPPSVCPTCPTPPQFIPVDSLLSYFLSLHSYNSTPLRFTNAQNSNTRGDQQCYYYCHFKFHYTTGV